MADIKLRLGLFEGTLELECNGADFETVMTRCEAMLEKFKTAKPSIEAVSIKPQEDSSSQSDEIPVEKPAEEPKPKRRRKGTSNSTNWKFVDDLLNEGQFEKLKAFYTEKAPGKQNDQVAVIAHQMKELLGREGFDGHELHTAFALLGIKTPANLNSVFANMAGESLGKLDDGKWKPNFKASNRVTHDLPEVPKKK